VILGVPQVKDDQFERFNLCLRVLLHLDCEVDGAESLKLQLGGDLHALADDLAATLEEEVVLLLDQHDEDGQEGLVLQQGKTDANPVLHRLQGESSDALVDGQSRQEDLSY
jgi:hypothetical protein